MTKGTYSSSGTQTRGSAPTQAGCRAHGHQVVSPRGDSAPSGAIILMSYFSNLGGAQVIYSEKLQCLSSVEIITGSTITAAEFPVAALCQRLYEKDCDSQPTAAEGKSPPAPPPTHKRRKERRWLSFIFSDQII